VLTIGLSGTAEAALQGRDLNGSIEGFEAYYDTDLNITWLADAKLSLSNTFGVGGISFNGTMTFDTAKIWIGAMNSANYLGFNDWRLPATSPVNGTAYSYSTSYNGTTDFGYNISAPGTTYSGSKASEMLHLFYNTLGNVGYCYPSSTANACSSTPNPVWLYPNTGPFVHLETSVYWVGTEYVPNADFAWYTTIGGYQDAYSKTYGNFAWAVRDGDVATVPEADTWAMLLAGLGLVGTVTQRRKQAEI
jgi:hypothetical protein